MTRLSKRGFVEGRPKKFTDPLLLEEKIDSFFQHCDSLTQIITNEKGQVKVMLEPYTISGLQLWLDCDDQTLINYEKDDVFRDIIKKAKKRVENWVEKKSLTGDINATTAIFNLKNNFGWKDKTEVETTDKTKESHEDWLKANQNILDVTPKSLEIS
jgi:hypothetical protein